MLDKNDVYQFIYGKRDEMLSTVTIYVIRSHFSSQYREDELDDILDLLVESGKLKTNGVRSEGGMRCFWVRRDPDKYTPEKDKGGFLTPCSPGHALKLLNGYMRTDLLKFIHGNVYERIDSYPRQSPLKHLIGAIKDVLASWKGTSLFESFNINPFHICPDFEFDAEEDLNHDIKLMTFHLTALRQTLKRIKEDAF